MNQLIKDVLGIKSEKKTKAQFREMFKLPVNDISDLIVTPDGRYIIVGSVSPINGELLPDDTLEEVADAIQGALSSFEGRIGIYIQSETVDVSANLSNIEKRKQELNSEFKIMLLEEQRKHLASMISKSRNVLNFYVALEIKAPNHNTAEQLLNDAFTSFKSELESQEMFVDRLWRNDLYSLLYSRMNPEQSLIEPYQEHWSLSDIVPSNAVLYEDSRHIEIENRLYRFFSITKYPLTVDKYRWLRKIFNTKGDLNISIIMTPKNKSTIQKELSKAVEEVGRKAVDDTQPEHIKQEYAVQQQSAKDMIMELGNENVSLFDTNITISVSGKDQDDLNTIVNSLRSKIASAYCMSTEIKYKEFNPFFTTLPIMADNKITRDYVWNLSSKDISSIIPFDSSEFMEESGTLIGDNEVSKGIVIVNYYNPIYNNSHECIIADTGFGKSFYISCDAIRNVPYVDYTIIFDLKGDLIFPWGQRYTFSATSGLVSNPFNIRNAIIDTDSDIDNGNVNVGVFLLQKIMDVIVFFKWIIRDMTSYDEALLEEDIRDSYEKCGLDHNSTSLPDIFCTMDTLRDVQNEKIQNSEGMEKDRRTYIRDCLKPYTSGAYAPMFNGQTTWDFDEFTVFDLSNLHEAVKKPLYDILLKDTWQFCKKDGTKKPLRKRVYVDECHQFADPQNPQTLEFISTKLSKQSRGFGVSLITATQNLPDFLSIPKHGQAIIDNSYFKLFGRLGESDLPVAQSLYKFSDAEMKILRGSTSKRKGGKGKGIFIVGAQRVVIQVRASRFELEIIDPQQYEDIYKAPSRFKRGTKISEV